MKAAEQLLQQVLQYFCTSRVTVQKEEKTAEGTKFMCDESEFNNVSDHGSWVIKH